MGYNSYPYGYFLVPEKVYAALSPIIPKYHNDSTSPKERCFLYSIQAAQISSFSTKTARQMMLFAFHLRAKTHTVESSVPEAIL